MTNFILGSQSPQRTRLLQSVYGTDRFDCIVSELDEPTFEDLNNRTAIQDRLQQVVRIKQAGILDRVPANCLSICADTIVVVPTNEGEIVLGKPAQPTWQQQTRQWFRKYYSDRQHEVWSAWQIWKNGMELRRGLQKTRVRFPHLSDDWIEWYINTNEPKGKAGGYGIQGHAAAFVQDIQGSLTNVIGLPLLEVVADLTNLGVLPTDDADRKSTTTNRKNNRPSQ